MADSKKKHVNEYRKSRIPKRNISKTQRENQKKPEPVKYETKEQQVTSGSSAIELDKPFFSSLISKECTMENISLKITQLNAERAILVISITDPEDVSQKYEFPVKTGLTNIEQKIDLQKDYLVKVYMLPEVGDFTPLGVYFGATLKTTKRID